MQVSMDIIVEAYGLTISNTALSLADLTGIDADDVRQADVLWCRVVAESIRERQDGTAPTTTVGWLHTTDEGVFAISGNSLLAALQLIRDGASDATVDIRLYRW